MSPSDGAARVSLRTKVRFPRNSPSKMVPWTTQLPPPNENGTAMWVSLVENVPATRD
jgi:hypothetical protein